MTTAKVVSMIRSARPLTYEDVDALGLSLRHIGSGSFRDVYRIRGFPLVIKIPMSVGKSRAIDKSHSNREMKKLNKIVSESYLKPLRRYMPKIYYHDKKSGIVVMRLYKPLKCTRCNYAVADILHNLVVDLLHNYSSDICPDNMGIYEHGKEQRFVILDLGCL